MGANQYSKQHRTDLVLVMGAQRMSIDKLAEASGISKATIGCLCSGTRDVKKLNITSFVRLAKALRIPVQELVKILGIE